MGRFQPWPYRRIKMEKITLTMPALAEAIQAGRTFAMANGAPVPAPQQAGGDWTWTCEGLTISGHEGTVLTVREYGDEMERLRIAAQYEKDIHALLHTRRTEAHA